MGKVIMAGYHIREIPRGILGKASKVYEEATELLDAEEQGNHILVLCELADIYGAIKACAEKYGTSLYDLEIMSLATERAFKDGSRKSS